MSKIKSLDDIDHLILKKLQVNAKITNSQLAKEIGLSPAPTLERVKKLEGSGIIKSYHAELDIVILGFGVSVFILASLKNSSRESFDSFVQKIQNIHEVIECHHITGSGDFMLKVITNDISTYNDFILNRLIGIDEIGNVQSMMVLSTLKESKILPLESE